MIRLGHGPPRHCLGRMTLLPPPRPGTTGPYELMQEQEATASLAPGIVLAGPEQSGPATVAAALRATAGCPAVAGLGPSPDGRATTIVQTSAASEMPGGFLDDAQLIVRWANTSATGHIGNTLDRARW